MSMILESSERMLLCVDSDFDFLFNGATEQSRLIRDSRYMFHTYTYATENYLCYAPSLHNVCVKATKNDTRIFDFERFMADYSRTIYRLFLWYAYSAKLSDEHVFTLVDFKSSVRLNYLDLEDNGAPTIAWLQRNVARREQTLASKHPKQAAELDDFAAQLGRLGVTPETTYLYMHGHTLMDNVVMVLLETVCEKLRQMTAARITASKKEGVALSVFNVDRQAGDGNAVYTTEAVDYYCSAAGRFKALCTNYPAWLIEKVEAAAKVYDGIRDLL